MISDFTRSTGDYTDFVHLPSEMITFGTYRLLYEPPEDCLEAKVDMSISSEASLPQMLELFKSFLAAAGYQIPLDQDLDFDSPVEKSIYDGLYTPGSIFFNSGWEDGK